MAIPIFVIGRNRSGTKWLSNTIANHENVACVQREGAGGILETNLFHYMPKIFGDLSIDENYLGFVACFSETNFFKLTGLDKDVLYSARTNDYFEFFRYIMDLYAGKEGTPFWLQKANVSVINELTRAFPDGHFVIIQRSIVENIRSWCGLALRAGRERGGMVRHTYQYVVAHKSASRFCKRKNVLGINYEDLRDDKETTVRKVFDFLGITFSDKILQDKYKKNTSFTGQVDKQRVLTRRDTFTIKLFGYLFGLMPAPVLEVISRMKFHRSARRKFMPKTFDLLKREHGWFVQK